MTNPISNTADLLHEANETHPVCCTCCQVCQQCGYPCLTARLAVALRQLAKAIQS